MSVSTICLLSCQLRNLNITTYIPKIPPVIHMSASVGKRQTAASIHVALCCNPFLLALFRASHVSRNSSVDAGCLCDKTVEVSVELKQGRCSQVRGQLRGVSLQCWLNWCSCQREYRHRSDAEYSYNCHNDSVLYIIATLTLILRLSRAGTVWFYTSTSKKRAARPKLYTQSLTRDLKRMYSHLKLVRISINP